LIEAEKANHRVATMCRVLGVSKSGFYDWLVRPKSQREIDNEVLTVHIRQIHERSRCTYGSPRLHAQLGHEGVRVGKNRVARLMRCAGIQGVHRRKRGRTAIPAVDVAPHPDLVERNFTVDRPDQLWVSDITYVRTWAGWLYVAITLDVFSRRVVGWAMGDSLRTELVLEALDMALWERQPGAGLIHHSDRGSQYTSFAFGRRCQEAGIAPSMGSKGDAYDNSMAERFFATLETELLWQHVFRNRNEARLAIFDFVEAFYNRERLHSSIGQLSPVEFERRFQERINLCQDESVR
jgi:putative transposase